MVIITINNDLTAMEGVTEVPFKFEYDSSTGKYGYRDGADTFRPFNDGGGSDPVLLWTNPSPTSAYTGGTIPITSYPYYIIEVRYSGSIDIIQTYILDINKSTVNSFYVASNRPGYSSYARGLTFNTNNVVFYSYAYQLGSSSGATSNQHCIPTRIWGCESAIPSGNSIQIPEFSFMYTASRTEYPNNAHTDLIFNNMNRYTNISIASIISATTVTLLLIGDGSIIYQTSGSHIENVSFDFSNISTLQIRLLVGSITIPVTTDYTLGKATDIVIS